MAKKIEAGIASLKVLEDWGVERIYGIPAGSLNTWMDALNAEQSHVDFIQVRHEEVGALAASMQYKFSGKIGVALGSGGPGATHLMNGLYDAREDNVPLLAIVGTRPLHEVNMDAFQELNQNPIYNDVAVYNKRVAYAEQLPKLIDEAIRTAYAHKGVAVVEVPVSFGWEKIDNDKWYSSANARRSFINPQLNEKDIDEAVALLNNANRPVIYAGIGTYGSGEDVVALSQKIKAPIAVTGKNYDNFDTKYEAFLGSAHRVARKPANDALLEADVVLFAGSNFPFAEVEGTFQNIDKFIQIDIDPQKLGKRHKTDAAILADAGDAIRAITEKVNVVGDSPWYRANVKNIKNWVEYMQKIETKTEGPLQLFQVYNEINKVADNDAIYSIDIGNTTQTSIRHLDLTPDNIWRTSALFATMGNALPGAIAAKLEYPNRQIWSIAGDGAFSMVYADLITAVQYKLSMIQVVFSNKEYGFIKNAQEESNHHHFGVDFQDVNYAMIAEAQGAIGYTVTEINQLKEVFKKAIKDEKNGKVVVIDAKITHDRPIPVELLKLDPKLYSNEEINEFKKRYEAEDLKYFRYFLEEEGLESKFIK